MARYFTIFPSRLTHTLRFAFFNAEEQGMVGSQAYAAEIRALGEEIRGVYILDMIGYNSDMQNIFEAHAGSVDPTVRDASVSLTEFLSYALCSINNLGPIQIYKGTSWPPQSEQADRENYDPAINRADHSSFQNQGYSAVIISEDFFTNKLDEPNYDPNPNYHQDDDIAIDNNYAAKIVCCVALAVKELAK